ncbi:MAG: calcium/sodium antiporter [Candidatus Aminicenantes bacterium]|nr:calcium/sodium antiporter [Candidatus Aminicenantes bacterium]
MWLFIQLILGFGILVLGAHFLVDGAVSTARNLKVSSLMIGLTVVAFGTSTPELFVNIHASLRGNAAIALGNILGSNIVNILLILGISAVIFPLAVGRGTVWKEIPLSLLAAILLGILANDRLIDRGGASILTRTDGLVFLCFFIVFLYYTVGIARNNVKREEEGHSRESFSLLKSCLWMAGGLVALTFGSRWVAVGATGIARVLGASESLIGLTIVAIGTSLPELATSVSAALKKNPEIAVGNIVGSNIFNIFFILGVSPLIRPLPFQPGNNMDVAVLIFSSLLLLFTMFTGKRHRLDRWEGGLFIVLYVGYLAYLIIQG